MNENINLFSANPIFLTAAQTAISSVDAVNTFVETIKPPEIEGGATMGEDSGWDYVKNALKALTAKRNLVMPDLVDYDVFAKQVDDMTMLLLIRDVYGGWVGNMKNVFTLLSKHLMKHAKHVRNALDALSKENSSYLKTFNEVNSLYADRNKKRETTVADNKAKAALIAQLKEAQQRVQELERKDGKT
jgi:hypothetical protein